MSVLERADDEELQCYLLQLVQAIRFERSDRSRLSQFLVERGMYWCHETMLIFYLFNVTVLDLFHELQIDCFLLYFFQTSSITEY